MMFAKVVAMRREYFIKGSELWTANIQHGLFRRRTAIARSIGGHAWNIIGIGRHSGPVGMTVWCQLVERCTEMRNTDVVSWGINGRVVKPSFEARMGER